MNSNEINERRLVRCLLKDGFREYPDLLKNKEANELFLRLYNIPYLKGIC